MLGDLSLNTPEEVSKEAEINSLILEQENIHKIDETIENTEPESEMKLFKTGKVHILVDQFNKRIIELLIEATTLTRIIQETQTKQWIHRKPFPKEYFDVADLQ